MSELRHSDGGIQGVIAHLGMPGTGKTYRAIMLLRRVRRAVFYDTVGNVGDGPRQNPMPGWVSIHGKQQLAQFLLQHRNEGFRVVYHPEHSEDEFDWVCRLLWEVRNVVFCIDEVWKFCTPGWMPQSLEQMAFAHRHRGITLIYTAQRPQKVCKDLLSIATEARVFRVVKKSDLDAIDENLDLPDNFHDQVRGLPNRAFFLRDEMRSWRKIRA